MEKVSKLSHIHFVGNKKARKRLINMGEEKKSIFEIGSPDIDLLKSGNLPNLIMSTPNTYTSLIISPF